MKIIAITILFLCIIPAASIAKQNPEHKKSPAIPDSSCKETIADLCYFVSLCKVDNKSGYAELLVEQMNKALSIARSRDRYYYDPNGYVTLKTSHQNRNGEK